MSLGTLIKWRRRTESTAPASVVCVPVTVDEFTVLAAGLHAAGRCWHGMLDTKDYAARKEAELVQRAGAAAALGHPWTPLSEEEVGRLDDVRLALSFLMPSQLELVLAPEAAVELRPAFDQLLTTLRLRLGAARVVGWRGDHGPNGLVWTTLPSRCDSWGRAWA